MPAKPPPATLASDFSRPVSSRSRPVKPPMSRGRVRAAAAADDSSAASLLTPRTRADSAPAAGGSDECLLHRAGQLERTGQHQGTILARSPIDAPFQVAD